VTNSDIPNDLDLRHYLNFVREKGRNSFVEVRQEISPRWETAAVVHELARKMRNPVLHFAAVENCSYPMVTNVCCSYDRVARSVGLSTEELDQRLCSAVQNSLPPVVLDSEAAPCRKRRALFDVFSLRDLPQSFYTDTQTEPYITSALIVARDPDSGCHNISFHRLMISSADSVAIYMTPGGHLHQIWHKNCANGCPTPLSAVIGAHPLWCYASLVSGAIDHDDYAVLGAVLGGPVALTPGLLDPDLLVPALAEFVLEGAIDPLENRPEGPFGEFLGFVAEQASAPIIRFESVSHRENPIFQDIVAGQSEHMTLSSVSLRARLRRDYLDSNPAVTEFWLPAAMTLFLSVDAMSAQTFDAHELMARMLHEERYLKQIVCFDSSVDLRKQSSVQSALACNVQPDRDVRLYEGLNGNGVDPSEIDGRTSKVAIDARPKKTVVKNALPAEFMQQFELRHWID
jgi:UbiD family decarboxylase